MEVHKIEEFEEKDIDVRSPEEAGTQQGGQLQE